MSLVQEIMTAVKSRDLVRVEALLAQDPGLVNARTEKGDSPILIAQYYGAKEIVSLFLERGARLNLFEAAAVGDLNRVRELVEADPSLVNAFAHDGFQPLGLAAFFTHPEIVRYLLSKGAQVNSAARNSMKVMPLHSAASRRHYEICKLLLDAGADVNARQAHGWTPLHQAAHHGDIELMELLISRGADLMARKDDGLTPLALAANEGHQKAAQWLYKQGAE